MVRRKATHFDRQCGRKVPLSQDLAGQVARKLQQQDRTPMVAYQCPYGFGHWHVGHGAVRKQVSE